MTRPTLSRRGLLGAITAGALIPAAVATAAAVAPTAARRLPAANVRAAILRGIDPHAAALARLDAAGRALSDALARGAVSETEHRSLTRLLAERIDAARRQIDGATRFDARKSGEA